MTQNKYYCLYEHMTALKNLKDLYDITENKQKLIVYYLNSLYILNFIVYCNVFIKHSTDIF